MCWGGEEEGVYALRGEGRRMRLGVVRVIKFFCFTHVHALSMVLGIGRGWVDGRAGGLQQAVQEERVGQGTLHLVSWPLLAGARLSWGPGGGGGCWKHQAQHHGQQQQAGLQQGAGCCWQGQP